MVVATWANVTQYYTKILYNKIHSCPPVLIQLLLLERLIWKILS